MPWCPKCRFEYVPQLHACPECKVRLVAELPEETVEQPAYGEGEAFEQVLLCTVVGEMHAALMRDALKAAGIQSRQQVMDDAFLPGYQGVPAANMARIGTYVNRRDLERAVQVYRKHEGGT